MTTLAVLPLLDLLRTYAEDPDLLDLLPPSDDERTWTRVHADDDVELWLISWPPGATTGWHDHGTATGALTVLQGTLVEHTVGGLPEQLTLRPGVARSFGAGHIHDVRNEGDETALSLHAYSPRLETMTRYSLRDGQLAIEGVEQAGEEW